MSDPIVKTITDKLYGEDMKPHTLFTRKEYARITQPYGCVVTVIEVVYESADVQYLDDLLEKAREYGAAQIVDQFLVTDDFDTASDVLRNRRKQNVMGVDK